MRRPGVVVLAACAFAVVYVALDFNKLYALRYGADTGAFVQWLSGAANGRGTWDAMEGRPHLQVHGSWGLLALAPLMRLWPDARSLLVAQIIAIAAAAPALTAFARACGATGAAATAVGLAWLLSPSAQGLAYGNVLENAYVPLVAALAALAVRRRAFVASLVCALALCSLKEDEALFALWWGGACARWWDRRIGLGVAAIGFVCAGGFALAELHAHARPSIPPYELPRPERLVDLVSLGCLLLAPFAFAPLALRWRLLLAAPLVAELLFVGPWAYAVTRVGSHWTAPLAIAAALAAAVALAHRPRWSRAVVAAAALVALTFNDTVLKIGRWPFVVDRAAFARAVALRETQRDVVVPRNEEGVYAVAAANPHVRLAPYDPREPYCPGYNRDPRAFFASLGIGAWPRDVVTCGGVAVTSRPPGPR